MNIKNWFSKKENKDETNSRKKENSIYKFLDREGFYMILFVCVCIVAVTAVWVTKTNIDRLSLDEPIEPPVLEQNEMVQEPSILEQAQNKPIIVVEEINEDEETAPALALPQINPQEDKKGKKTLVSQPKDKKEKPKVITSPENEIKGEITLMKMPLTGKIGMNYAADTLTYSKTLEQYTTHHGIDIIAPENTPVAAVLPGEVIDITRDAKLGLTIIIAHGEDILTKYANLSTDAMVDVGDYVEEGQIISGVGKNALFEISEEPHLHFEVIIEGKCVDPNKYLPIKQ